MFEGLRTQARPKQAVVDNAVADEFDGPASDEEMVPEKMPEPIPMTDTYKPTSDANMSDAQRFKADMDKLPDALTDQELANVEPENVALMLMQGMKRRDGTSWKPGQSLQEGGLIEAQVAVPKQRGAGLGSEASNVFDLKPGQTVRGTLVAAGDRPRNYVGVSEKLVKRKVIEVGALVVITAGPHEGEAAIVKTMPATDGIPRRDDKVTLELKCSGGSVSVPFGALRLHSHLDEERSKYKKRQEEAHEEPPAKRAKKEKAVPLEWVLKPDMLVRFIDRSYADGKYYNEKLRVFDITSLTDFSLRTNDGAIIEGVVESQVETVIPRELNSKLVVLRGSKKGNIVVLAEKDKKNQEVIVMAAGSRTKTYRYSYYDVCAI